MSDDANAPPENIEVEAPAKEDAETSAARRELKQTSISERGGQASPDSVKSPVAAAQDAEPASSRPRTPDGAHGEDKDALREQVSSPGKKKRARDELDDVKDLEGGAKLLESVTELPPNDGENGGRAGRSEPEKKRARDTQAAQSPDKAGTTTEKGDGKLTTVGATSETKDGKPQTTSASAFAKSGFAKLASSSASPFGALTASSGSGFGSAVSGSASPFGAFGAAKAATPAVVAPAAPPKLSFGGDGGASPFAVANGTAPKTFGSAFGAGFGGGFGASKLTSFAHPAGDFKKEKSAKPFGAPDSDAEPSDAEDDEDAESSSKSEDGVDAEKDKEKTKEDEKDEPKLATEDKKRKLHRVIVDDGEAGEATLLQVRAKMYVLEDKQVGWKERGAGMLKVNVPERCVSFDPEGGVLPGSFDASCLEDDDEEEGTPSVKNVRLIMRQDSTLRVILNTVVFPGTSFQERKQLKSSTVLFNAFDGSEPKPVQMKVLMSEITAIQKELSGL